MLDVLRKSGYRSVTIGGIARGVQRARTSIYRRWPSKRHLVAYAVISELGDDPAPDTGDLRLDLEGAVKTLWNAFGGPLNHSERLRSLKSRPRSSFGRKMKRAGGGSRRATN